MNKVLTREPALTMGVVAAILAVVVSAGVPVSEPLKAGILALAAAVLALITRSKVSPVTPATPAVAAEPIVVEVSDVAA